MFFFNKKYISLKNFLFQFYPTNKRLNISVRKRLLLGTSSFFCRMFLIMSRLSLLAIVVEKSWSWSWSNIELFKSDVLPFRLSISNWKLLFLASQMNINSKRITMFQKGLLGLVLIFLKNWSDEKFDWIKNFKKELNNFSAFV